MPTDDIIRANLDTATQALIDIQAEFAGHPAGDAALKALSKIIARRMGSPEKYVEGRVSVQIPGATSPARQLWAKWVLAVDCHQRTGYAFEGPFLKPGLTHSLPPGAVVLMHESERAAKKLGIMAQAVVVRADGGFGDAVVASGPHWALGLRDHVAALLKQPRLPA